MVSKETAEHYYITWEDHPEMLCPHLKVILIDPSNKLVKVSGSSKPETPQPSKIDILPEITKPKKIKKPKPKPSLPVGIKLGDHVCNLETGSIGNVVHLCDRCINIATDGSIESHNLELGVPRLEILQNSGYFEHYQPVIKGAKSYWYRRYVYVDISGKLRHHHVPNKLCESIEALWRSGATAKEICLALGKQYSGKNST